jgi:hypothetical protein
MEPRSSKLASPQLYEVIFQAQRAVIDESSNQLVVLQLVIRRSLEGHRASPAIEPSNRGDDRQLNHLGPQGFITVYELDKPAIEEHLSSRELELNLLRAAYSAKRNDARPLDELVEAPYRSLAGLSFRSSIHGPEAEGQSAGTQDCAEK